MTKARQDLLLVNDYRSSVLSRTHYASEHQKPYRNLHESLLDLSRIFCWQLKRVLSHDMSKGMFKRPSLSAIQAFKSTLRVYLWQYSPKSPWIPLCDLLKGALICRDSWGPTWSRVPASPICASTSENQAFATYQSWIWRLASRWRLVNGTCTGAWQNAHLKSL